VFGCTLLPVWVTIFIFGSILALFSNSSKSTIEQFCDNVDFNSEQISESREFVSGIDDIIGNLVSQKMCSDVCPCPDDETKEPWLAMEEAVLNSFGRTKRAFSTQNLEPLVFFGGKGQKTYTKFEECYFDIRKGETSEAKSEVQQYEDTLKEGALNFALDFSSFFEGAYQCSALCQPALFYYSLDLDWGRPTKPCLYNLKDEVSNNLSYMGISAILVGIIMMITWLVQYCLWKRFEYN